MRFASTIRNLTSAAYIVASRHTSSTHDTSPIPSLSRSYTSTLDDTNLSPKQFLAFRYNLNHNLKLCSTGYTFIPRCSNLTGHRMSTTMARASTNTQKPKKREKKLSWIKKQRLQKEARLNVKKQQQKDSDDCPPDESFVSPMSSKASSSYHYDRLDSPLKASAMSRVAPSNVDKRPAPMATASIDTHCNKRLKETGWMDKQVVKRVTVLSQRTEGPDSHFPFLSLPAEIRNMIYGYTLHAPIKFSLNRESCRKYRKKRKQTAWLHCPMGANVNLVRVCHQIYHETKAILFELNTFYLCSFLLPDLRNATRSWPIFRSVQSLDLDFYCTQPRQVLNLVKTVLEYPTIRLRNIKVGLHGLAAMADISALRYLNVEDSVVVRVYTYFTSPPRISAIQAELDLEVPKMMSKLYMNAVYDSD